MTSKLTALIVDDDPVISETLKKMLEELGVDEVVVAKDARRGLFKYKVYYPDIAFLDIQLPDMHGIDVLTEFKKIKPSGFVVVITAFGKADVVQKILEKGANGYVVKPFTEQRLQEVLTQYKMLCNKEDGCPFWEGRR